MQHTTAVAVTAEQVADVIRSHEPETQLHVLALIAGRLIAENWASGAPMQARITAHRREVEAAAYEERR